MMTWILVSNHSTARLVSCQHPKQIKREEDITILANWIHPESRQHNSDLTADASGSRQHQGNPGTFTEKTSAHKEEGKKFATECAEYLNHAYDNHLFDHLILVCSPAFLGELRAKLTTHTTEIIQQSHSKDYTHFSDHDLAEALGKLIRGE